MTRVFYQLQHQSHSLPRQANITFNPQFSLETLRGLSSCRVCGLDTPSREKNAPDNIETDFHPISSHDCIHYLLLGVVGGWERSFSSFLASLFNSPATNVALRESYTNNKTNLMRLHELVYLVVWETLNICVHYVLADSNSKSLLASKLLWSVFKTSQPTLGFFW